MLYFYLIEIVAVAKFTVLSHRRGRALRKKVWARVMGIGMRSTVSFIELLQIWLV